MPAHDPAAAHFPRRPIKIFLPEAQAGQNIFRFRFDLVTTQIIELCLRLMKLVRGMFVIFAGYAIWWIFFRLGKQ